MYRTAASRLRSLKGRTSSRFSASTRSPARYASSSAAVLQSSSSGGLFGWLTGRGSNSSVPPGFQLPGVQLPPPLPDFVEPGKTKITTLPNGVKIASETSPNPAASIGLYIDCGSIYESPDTSGATHLLERMAFKSTRNRSHLRVVREVEAVGGLVQASASREQMGYTFDALKTYVPEMVELLIDSVRNPVFLDWEVNEQKVKSEISEASNNPHGLLLEAIHSAGFSGALANPLLAPESAINRLNSTLLEEFIAENYTAPRMVLAASGVDHEELVSIAEPLLSDLPKISRNSEPQSVYTGGEFRCQAGSGDLMTHFALAFELPGGWHQDKDAMILTVLQMLMGGGGSFSSGGPGKGLHSRLYLNVMNKYPQIQSFSALNNIYNTTALFGIQATTTPDFAAKAVDVAVSELIAIATPGEVDSLELARAKQATKSAILMNLESRMVASEDIGRQVLMYNERKPAEHYLKAIDGITEQDITKVAQKLISSPLTMASYGDVINVPTYDYVSRKFKSK
ncbi:Mitochondrial-processing peptidase subunit alpha [Linum grandiflorum]